MTVVLEAGVTRMEVDPADGGRWTALVVDDLSLLASAELPGAYPPTLSGCFPMAPYAGRVRDGVLAWRGQLYALPRTAAPHAIHGTVVDVPWQLASCTASQARLEVALDARWPFRGRVRQELHLHPDRLVASLVLEVEQEMPVVLGLHPWFRRQLVRGGPVEVLVEDGRQYVRGPDGTPTGQLVPLRPGPWDDCLTDLPAPPGLHWPGALTLTWRSSGKDWVVFDELPDVVCVEPQTGPPDAVRLGRAQVVPAGGSARLDVELAWVRDDPPGQARS